MMVIPPVSTAADDLLSRRGRENGPTRVYVAMGLLDIDEIDSAAQNFTANLFMEVRWMDPRLAHGDEAHRIFPLSKVWNPQILFVNQQKIWPTFPDVVYVEPDGEVLYRQRASVHGRRHDAAGAVPDADGLLHPGIVDPGVCGADPGRDDIDAGQQ